MPRELLFREPLPREACPVLVRPADADDRLDAELRVPPRLDEPLLEVDARADDRDRVPAVDDDRDVPVLALPDFSPPVARDADARVPVLALEAMPTD